MDQPSAQDLVEQLRRRNPFDRMAEEHVAWLGQHMHLANFAQEAVVLSPEQPCDALYFIHRGTVVIEAMGKVSGEKRVLAELVEGESFPLEALEQGCPAFSIWRAKTDTLCYKISLQDFERLKRMSTIFAEFCKYRAASFLEQSRRVYRLHYSHQSEEQQRLGAQLSILMRRDTPSAGPEQAIRRVLDLMRRQEAEVVVIAGQDGRPLGLFTLADLLDKVVLAGMDLQAPVSAVMDPSFQALPPTALGYEAALVMAEGLSRHILVVEQGRYLGVVTDRELFNLLRVSLTQINAEIRAADSLETVARCARDIHLLAETMLMQGVSADQITQIISSLNDQVFGRTLELKTNGFNQDGIRVCWIALGSEGRLEQTFATDQDNAIIFLAPPGMSDQEARAKLLPGAAGINQALDHIGFPLCQGNIMASNPQCCLSLQEWQRRFSAWIDQPTPEALLGATIFFDFRHLHGDTELSDQLQAWLGGAVAGQRRFLHLLAENALGRTPPIGFFRDFILEDHPDHPKTIDIKLDGVTLLVDAARVYALDSRVTRSNTKQRLLMAGDKRHWPQSDINAWAEAFSFLQSLRVRHQSELQRGGLKSHNRMNPYELNNLDRKFLLESLRQAGKLQKKLGQDFIPRGM